ncbi:MAG: alanine--tRNA ligase [Candidatus Omnitrophota bacterium]
MGSVTRIPFPVTRIFLMKADVLRQKFLDFFKSKKHKIVGSDSLVPVDDPTVLFTPAGMNQFKKQLLGYVTDFKRAASSQRCLRTDDLDKVGKTSGHHTFFEMLGNFSFGDYFKQEAITWAWEFLTEELKIKQGLLWVSVYKDDHEAYDIWQGKIKIPVQRIIKLGDKDNFWPSEAREKGPNGPCGPCSEIFFDYGRDKGCGKPGCGTPACDCGRFVEVWNLVFTQFNRKDNSELESLPQKNIDTGMGLERLAAVMQNARNNFDTELFQPLLKEINRQVKTAGENKELGYAVSDHIRAVTFTIYDGVLPSNESRGYVVRKLIRKSCSHLRALGIEQLFLHKLVPIVAEIMKVSYPQLQGRRENIAEIILAEEKNFQNILDSSGDLLKDKFKDLSGKDDPEKAGIIAFQLYDTYGMPFDLIKDWLDKSKIKISLDVFNRELDSQKSRSKSESAMKGDVFEVKDLVLDVKDTKFLGYKNIQCDAKILKILKNNLPVKKITVSDTAEIILDKTVFYPESGGQIGDTGELIKGKSVFEVLDTKKAGGAIIHIGRVKAGSFKSSDELRAQVNSARRLSIAGNHTATHLLQAALRNVLGVHVQQQGSLVEEDKLRFDFTHFKNITDEDLDRIEEIVNSYVLGNFVVDTREMALSEAKKTAALAFFAEKYAGKVRVVSIGDFSKEFCGGTHLSSTGQIGYFKIIHEGAVASGVRRIEAATGKSAHKIIKEQRDIIKDISFNLKVPAQKIIQELAKKLTRIKELERQLTSQKSVMIQDYVPMLIKKAEKINDISFIAAVEQEKDMDSLRKIVDMVKQQADNTVIALGSQYLLPSPRALLVIGVTPDLLPRGLDASEMVVEAAKAIGGSGGGRKDFAQAGGNKPENLSQAFEKLRNILKQI